MQKLLNRLKRRRPDTTPRLGGKGSKQTDAKSLRPGHSGSFPAKEELPAGALKSSSGTDGQPPAIDASTRVSMHGNTINVGEAATATFVIGAQINQPAVQDGLDKRIHNMKRSHNAEYNMTANVARGPCTPDTRIVALQKIMDWSQTGEAMLYWLSGMAGTGKTTMAFSVSQMLQDIGLLGASFFCSRLLPDCREIMLILPTLAAELSRRYPAFGDALAAVLVEDPDVLQRELDVQLHKLIIRPWAAKKAHLPKGVVVVLDALDECNESHAQFIQVLFNNITKLPFKILITSRPEPTIRDAMKAKGPRHLSRFVLHDVEDDLVRADILKYLKSQLSHRTTPDIIDRIADLAGTLFIYAATLVRLFISSKTNIVLRLQILQNSSPTPDKSKMLAPLDELYKGVLAIILADDLLESEKQEIKDILDTIVCAREPLTRRTMAELWALEEDEINRRLESLYSIITVPEDHDRPVTALHASLPEFMLDGSRSGDFCCKSLQVNLQLTQQCLAIMDRDLHQNLCQVDGDPSNSLIKPELIDTLISPGLRYASVYMAEHCMLTDLSNGQEVWDSIRAFLMKQVLCWVECLSLLGKLPVAVESLETLLNALTEDTRLAALVYDLLRLVQFLYEFIQENAVAIHSYALTWVPIHSPLRTHYAKLFERVPRVLCGFPTDWTGPERMIRCPDVACLAISQDGSRIAAGSWDSDGSIRILDMRNQVEECTLTGHRDFIDVVAISWDGNQVVSASEDNTIRIWDVVARKTKFTLKPPSETNAIAISFDKDYIASAHDDCIIRIWNSANGKRVQSIEGHEGEVESVSFVPKRNLLISGSVDGTARIWDYRTGQIKHILYGHTDTVWSVACSPSGHNIITGSRDMTARIWDLAGHQLCALQGHSDGVKSVAFLPDGKRVATCSYDRTLRIWDIATGETERLFTEGVNYDGMIAFPDGVRVASYANSRISIWGLRGRALVGGTADRSIPEIRARTMVFSANGRRVLLMPSLHVLDTETLKETATLHPAPGKVSCAAFSDSAARIATSTSQVIKLWGLEGGAAKEELTLEGHSKDIWSLSFSHDERWLVSTSEDKTARVWDIVTGRQTQSLRHAKGVHHASISYDSSYIITAIEDIAYIWDMQSGQRLRRFNESSQTVTFTPNDQYIIITDVLSITIYDSQTHKLVHTYEDDDSDEEDEGGAEDDKDDQGDHNDEDDRGEDDDDDDSEGEDDVNDTGSGDENEEIDEDEEDKDEGSSTSDGSGSWGSGWNSGDTGDQDESEDEGEDDGTDGDVIDDAFDFEHENDSYYYWTTLSNGASYALRADGWVYHITSFGDQPRKLAWIPLQYRPPPPTDERTGFGPAFATDDFNACGPLFTSSSQGIRVCLPRRSSLVTIVIPHGH